jgi:DNA-directed RNA polymerase II subunit RPB2
LKKNPIDDATVKLKIESVFILKPGETYMEVEEEEEGENDEIIMIEKKKKNLPYYCRRDGLTYSSNIYISGECAIIHNSQKKVKYKIKKACIGQVPIITFSDKCYLKGCKQLHLLNESLNEIGGYFIINGNEKVVVLQEMESSNALFIRKSKGINIIAITSERNNATKRFEIFMDKDGIIYAKFQYLQINYTKKNKSAIPIIILLKALGLSKIDEIYNFIDLEQNDFYIYLKKTIDFGKPYKKTESMNFIQEKTYYNKRIDFIMNYVILPHIGIDENSHKMKAIFICHMIYKLVLLCKGVIPVSDRDEMSMKRFEIVGDLMKKLFKSIYRGYKEDFVKIVKKIKKRKHKNKLDIKSILEFDKITNSFNYHLATGYWPGKKLGISQALERINEIRSLSHRRRIIHQINSNIKILKLRGLHPSSYNFYCPCETPEGESCGLQKHASILATITRDFSIKFIFKLLKKYNFKIYEVFKNIKKEEKKTLFINGAIVGYVKDLFFFVNYFKSLKRKNRIPFDISISYHLLNKEVYIWGDKGRFITPYHFLNEKTKKRDGIEYIDVYEKDNILVDEKIGTHIEIDKLLQLGSTAGLIPFVLHNPAPRNSYSSIQLKQSIGTQIMNHKKRFDTITHKLYYPQNPLITTRITELVYGKTQPFGMNVFVAIASYSGYDQEDAIIINQGFIDRGGMVSSVTRCVKSQEDETVKFGRPDKVCPNYNKRTWEYTNNKFPGGAIGEDGIIRKGVGCKYGDILFAKYYDPNIIKNKKRGSKIKKKSAKLKKKNGPLKDHSETHTRKNRCYVQEVIRTKNKYGHKLCKVKLGERRIPQMGDKFSTRHGQKGVTGIVTPQQDMPFNRDGVCPDFMINPHCIPSRMTIGQLLEAIYGKVACLDGEIKYDTDFDSFEETKREIERKLMENGMNKYGNEVLINGKTGKIMKATIFMGFIYTQKLNHMIEDKIHARSTGPKHILTQQPVKGKRRHGGLRFGKMGINCMISHGCASLLNDRLFSNSDEFHVYVCDRCGLIANANRRSGVYECRVCGNIQEISKVSIPYAYKLLLQELMAMSITPRLILN